MQLEIPEDKTSRGWGPRESSLHLFLEEILLFCSSSIHLWEFCSSSAEASSIMKFCLSSLLLDFCVHGNFIGSDQNVPQSDIYIMGLHQ